MNSSPLENFSSGAGLIDGDHAQTLVDALRKLDGNSGSIYRTPTQENKQTRAGGPWSILEAWMGIVIEPHHDNSEQSSPPLNANDPPMTPAMYWVQRCYIAQAFTNDPVKIYPSTDDYLQFYPAVNAPELLQGTNVAELGQQVLVYTIADRAGTKRFVFVSPMNVRWIACTSPIPSSSGGSDTGGSAYYNAVKLNGSPVTIDSTTNLVIPLAPGETINTQSIVAENSAEANQGDPPSHWVPCGTNYASAPSNGNGTTASKIKEWFPAWLVGYSNETPARPVYRFFSPKPGPVDIALTSADGVTNIGGGSPITLGSGRYAGVLLRGSGWNVDWATAFTANGGGNLDPGFILDNGSGANVPPSSLCIWSNTFESGANTAPVNFTYVVGIECIVTGYFRGMCLAPTGSTHGLVPLYYGHAPPTNSLFPVQLTQYSSSGANNPNYTYVVQSINANGLGYAATYAQPPGTSPIIGRTPFPYANAGSSVYSPATWGLAYKDNTGKIWLWMAFENEAPAGFSGTGAYTNFTFLNGVCTAAS